MPKFIAHYEDDGEEVGGEDDEVVIVPYIKPPPTVITLEESDNEEGKTSSRIEYAQHQNTVAHHNENKLDLTPKNAEKVVYEKSTVAVSQQPSEDVEVTNCKGGFSAPEEEDDDDEVTILSDTESASTTTVNQNQRFRIPKRKTPEAEKPESEDVVVSRSDNHHSLHKPYEFLYNVTVTNQVDQSDCEDLLPTKKLKLDQPEPELLHQVIQSDFKHVHHIASSMDASSRAMFPSTWTHEMIQFYGRPIKPITLKAAFERQEDDYRFWEHDEHILAPSKRVNRHVRCTNCQQFGHYARKCPEEPKGIICTMCGSQNEHPTKHCPKTLCLNCGDSNDSFVRSCKMCSKRSGCNCAVCGAKGHFAKCCPNNWRRFHATTKGTLAENDKNNSVKYLPRSKLSCANCGARGHNYYDCKGQRSGQNFPPHKSLIIEEIPVFDPAALCNLFTQEKQTNSSVHNPPEGHDVLDVLLGNAPKPRDRSMLIVLTSAEEKVFLRSMDLENITELLETDPNQTFFTVTSNGKLALNFSGQSKEEFSQSRKKVDTLLYHLARGTPIPSVEVVLRVMYHRHLKLGRGYRLPPNQQPNVEETKKEKKKLTKAEQRKKQHSEKQRGQAKRDKKLAKLNRYCKKDTGNYAYERFKQSLRNPAFESHRIDTNGEGSSSFNAGAQSSGTIRFDNNYFAQDRRHAFFSGPAHQHLTSKFSLGLQGQQKLQELRKIDKQEQKPKPRAPRYFEQN